MSDFDGRLPPARMLASMQRRIEDLERDRRLDQQTIEYARQMLDRLPFDFGSNDFYESIDQVEREVKGLQTRIVQQQAALEAQAEQQALLEAQAERLHDRYLGLMFDRGLVEVRSRFEALRAALAIAVNEMAAQWVSGLPGAVERLDQLLTICRDVDLHLPEAEKLVREHLQSTGSPTAVTHTLTTVYYPLPGGGAGAPDAGNDVS